METISEIFSLSRQLSKRRDSSVTLLRNPPPHRCSDPGYYFRQRKEFNAAIERHNKIPRLLRLFYLKPKEWQFPKNS